MRIIRKDKSIVVTRAVWELQRKRDVKCLNLVT